MHIMEIQRTLLMFLRVITALLIATITAIIPSAATAVSVINGVEVQQQEVRSSSSNYSCGNSKVEVAERITRILFVVSS